MKYIFIDNFRGFTKTLIPIKDVNFLIGENSTGKSSVLALIGLLSSPYFWFHSRFVNDEIELGYFKDIATNGAKDFSIAFVNDDNFDTEDKVKCIYIKFCNKEGVPFVTECSYVKNNIVIKIKVSKTDEEIKYKYSKTSRFEDKDKIKDDFLQWINECDETKRGFKRLNKYTPSFIFKLVLVESSIGIVKNVEVDTDMVLLFNNFSWSAPVRAKPQRTYDGFIFNVSPEGLHTPYLLKQMINDNETAELNDIGRKSGLFDSVEINNLGKGKESPFQLNITKQGNSYNIANVGYGVSQSLPLISEIVYRNKNCAFAIQQPEVHLHPRAQASFGEFIYKIAKKDNKIFMIETHSDFIIDRYRITTCKDKDENKKSAQVLYFENNELGNTIFDIPISDNGQYPQNTPSGFKEFFINEELALLEV